MPQFNLQSAGEFLGRIAICSPGIVSNQLRSSPRLTIATLFLLNSVFIILRLNNCGIEDQSTSLFAAIIAAINSACDPGLKVRQIINSVSEEKYVYRK